MSALLEYGDMILLLDMKPRRGQQHRYLLTLKEGGEFHTHNGFVPHADIAGQPECSLVKATKGAQYRVLRPTLEDFVVEMPRGAQVIYPKDLAPICMLADIGPGMRVFESGVGSGALSMTMLRWGADITGYELREDFANKARSNVRAFLGAGVLDRYHVELRDCYEGIDGDDYDRVVLDLPEPWNVVPLAERAMLPGGILVAYTPSITQAVQVRQAMHNHRWISTRTLEVLNRGWHIEGMAVRPDHRMVAHTAFLTVGRLLERSLSSTTGTAIAEPFASVIDEPAQNAADEPALQQTVDVADPSVLLAGALIQPTDEVVATVWDDESN